ncbi:MAG: DUF3137 domain-containing protein [Patescibacteria group bacterium]
MAGLADSAGILVGKEADVMMHIRTTIPDEATLRQRIADALPDSLTAVEQTAGPLEATYIKKLQQSRRGLGLVFLAAIILLVFFGAGNESVISVWWLLGLLLLAISLGIFGWRLIAGTSAAITAFNTAFKRAVVPRVFALFDLTGTRLVGEGRQVTQVKDLLDHSELITEPRNHLVVDDIYSLSVDDRPLLLAELDVKHVTRRGKHTHMKKIFRGYFLTLELPRTLSGKTFVSTEGDKNGFAHKDFWDVVTGNTVEETELEWNDFENLLHVASSDPTEARYILTPDFMQDLYAWWQEKPGNIRLAFIGQRLYLLFPDDGIRVSTTVPHIDPHEVQQYIESMAVPLLHVLHLLEDVEGRFRS